MLTNFQTCKLDPDYHFLSLFFSFNCTSCTSTSSLYDGYHAGCCVFIWHPIGTFRKTWFHQDLHEKLYWSTNRYFPFLSTASKYNDESCWPSVLDSVHSTRSPGKIGPTPDGVPVRMRSPSCKWCGQKPVVELSILNVPQVSLLMKHAQWVEGSWKSYRQSCHSVWLLH